MTDYDAERLGLCFLRRVVEAIGTGMETSDPEHYMCM